MKLKIESSARSEQGHRATHQDALALDPSHDLFVVADGSQAGGADAARLACETLHERLRGVAPAQLSAASEEQMRQLIQGAVDQANQRVLALGADPAQRGLTTMAMVQVTGDAAHVAHVGDSRVYRIHDRRIEALTRDHSLEHYLEDNPGAQPRGDYSGKTLVRTIGLEATPPQIDYRRVELSPDDVLLLCSDGITTALTDAVLREILLGALATSAEDAAVALIRAAMSHGGTDNITAAVLRTRKELDTTKTVQIDPTKVGGLQLGWLVFADGQHADPVVTLQETTRVGADARCTLRIDDGFVSSSHAEIFRTFEGFSLRDLGSTNGTFVNKVKVAAEQQQALVDGDRIRFGKTTLIFKAFIDQREGL